MAYRNYADLRSSRTEYTRVLPNAKYGFRGVDFTSSPHKVELYRMPDARNVYRDYRSDEGGAVETIPGFRRISSFSGEEIFGIHRFDDKQGNIYLAVHAGDALYIGKEAQRDELESAKLWQKATGALAKAPSKSFVYNGVFYILDGTTYQRLAVEESEGTLAYTLQAVTDVALRPRVWLYGEQHEQRNLLTDAYTVTLHGSEGVEAIETSADNFSGDYYNKKYNGTDTLVFSESFYCTNTYENKGINCLVLRSKDEEDGTSSHIQRNAGVTVVTDTSLKSLMLWASAGNALTVGSSGRADTFAAFKALEQIYIRSDKSADDYTPIHFNGDVGLRSNGGQQVYFNFPVSSINSVFSSDIDRALNALPANVVAKQGIIVVAETRSINAHITSETTIAKSNEIILDLTQRSDSNIVIDSYASNGDIRIFVGSKVPVGRYYYFGSAKNIYADGGIDGYVVYTIDVLAADAELYEPAQYVFDYNAEPVVFALPEKTESVESVTDGEYDAGFGCIYDSDGNIGSVGAIVRTGENDVDIRAVATDFHVVSGNATVLEANPDYKGTGVEAVNGCTLCAIYDDRIFLSGNPALPNTVFYSQRNDMGVTDPTYFGVLNYVNDGVGWEPITGMFTFSDTLCVTKRDTVYYHAGAEGNDVVTRLYPSVRGNTGLGSLGACCCFLDDPVMLTREGVWGVNKETLTLERTLGRRSSMVDARLLREKDLHKAELVEWEGYLCLFVNGNVYMADSRATHTGDTGTEYEWFYLAGVGVHKSEDGLRHPYYAAVTGDPITEDGISLLGKTVVRDGEEYELTETHETLIFSDSEVFDAPLDLNGDGITADSELVPVAVRDGLAYLVYKTAEYEKNGTFHAGVHPLVVENRLYFCNDVGDIYVFNNDKRGVAVGDEEMPPSMIHRTFYSFDGERIDSGFATRLDNCDIPHLTKSTSPRSMTVRAKLLDGAAYSVSVYTEKNPTYTEVFASSPFTFGGEDFGSTAYYAGKGALMVGRERERQWVEKQYLLRDGGFECPLGIYDISYRYRVAGRIKD